MLVAFAAMAGIQNDVAATVVQARLIPTDFTRLAEHPVLRQTIPINAEILTSQACLSPTILTDDIMEKKKFSFFS